jgi:Secretion system C-terminal sorting domain
MKKIYALCALLCALSNVGFAQFTVDGNMNEAGYTTTIAKQNSNYCFFPPNTDNITAIKVGKDASNLYIGVVGNMDITTSNNIMLLINFSQPTGVPAGTPLNVAMAGGPFEKNFSAGMEVDYMIRMNSGSGPNCYVNAMKRVGTNVEGYLENPGVGGMSLGGLTGGGVFGSPGVAISFLNTGTATSGFEIKIPFASVSISASNTVQVFAVVVSNDGYFSDITVPGNVTGGCLGYDGIRTGTPSSPLNFNTLAGGSYASTAIALPIELINFTAKSNNNTINLAWQTATEKNNSHFDIERSANGNEWSKIGVVKGSGTSQQRIDYRFADEKPLNTINYYRLKQMDFDGQFNYSPVVTAVAGKGKLKGIFPNPTADKITLVGNDLTNDDVITIFDLNGRSIKTQKVSGSQIDVSDLARGFYILSISDISGQAIERVRFVKQ